MNIASIRSLSCHLVLHRLGWLPADGSCEKGILKFTTVRNTWSVLQKSSQAKTVEEVKWSASHSVVSDSLWSHGLYSLWNSPGQNTGVGSLSLLQGIFPTQGSNSRLLHCRWILYQLSHKGSPRILEWVAYPFSSGSSWSQESNQGLLHCRRILSQLSSQGSPEGDDSKLRVSWFIASSIDLHYLLSSWKVC